MTKPKGKKSTRTPKLHDWATIQAEWEAGDKSVTFQLLSVRHGVSRQIIGRHAKGWKRVEVTPSIRKAAQERADEKSAARPVTGEVLPEEAAPTPAVTSALAVDAAIERRASIIDRHRQEGNIMRNRIYAAAQDNSFEKAKLAKILCESFTILHADERKSWSLDGPPTMVVQFIPPSPRDRHD